ncbi:hypothetical protein [Paenibacillus sp.]|uniref:hypothetical protein n=1 Tax=Paenibacillus sp. TaxID=58172 RepID=UPI002D2AE559|nr:hypothetical protein [Paenibacillus sp.]HZG56716.1 hypothetical protein [Paenibacillus sp.]
MEQTSYQERLRGYQETYASTLDGRSAAVKLHEAAAVAIRQAAAATEPIARARKELRALKLLNALSTWIKRSAAHPCADAAVCDALIACYALASLQVHRGRYDEALELVRRAIR